MRANNELILLMSASAIKNKGPMNLFVNQTECKSKHCSFIITSENNEPCLLHYCISANS